MDRAKAERYLSMYEKKLKHMQGIVKEWNLSDMMTYVQCKNDTHVCNFVGFNAILDKFNHHKTTDKAYPDGRREFEISDRPERLKKAFDIVIMICKHPRSNLRTMKYIQEFLKVYTDLLREYDKNNSQEYREKILHAFRQGLYGIERRAKQKRQERR